MVRYNPPSMASGMTRAEIVEFLNMGDNSTCTNCSVSIDEPIFAHSPRALQFPRTEPFSTSSIVLTLRNQDKVARRVRVIPPTSNVLVLSAPRTAKGVVADNAKIGAGMEVKYKVTFQPDSNKTITYKLIVVTEREKFVIPVMSSSGVGSLDVPASIQFPPTTVKVSETRMFTVGNVGTSECSFLLTSVGPFSVSPSRGELQVGETMQISCAFSPSDSSSAEGKIEYRTMDGQAACTRLSGLGRELPISLSKDGIEMRPTFISRSQQVAFKLINASPVYARYSMKRFKTSREDVGSEDETAELGGQDESVHVDCENSSDEEDAILRGGDSVNARSTKRMVSGNIDRFSEFSDPAFTVFPISGDIPGYSEVEIVVTFRPNDSGVVERTLYCDVQGRADRLPLHLKGFGIGPKAIFSYDVLDVGEVYSHTPYKYEVNLSNRGDIPAPFRFVAHPERGTHSFHFFPESGILDVGGAITVFVTMTATSTGPFNEIFTFDIAGCKDPLELELRGSVRGPSFAVDLQELDFGKVSYGFKYFKSLTIRNTCDVACKFFATCHNLTDAADVVLRPQTGTILPRGQQRVDVQFVPSHMGHFSTEFVSIDVFGCDAGPSVCPLRAECMLPALSLSQDVVDFGESFVRHPASTTIKLLNESDLPANFELISQDAQSMSLAICTIAPVRGTIEPHTSVDVDVQLATERLGNIQLPMNFRVIGPQESDPVVVLVQTKSKGPQVAFTPDVTRAGIDFGVPEVLTTEQREFSITNNSPISASFKTFIPGPSGVYAVSPREGVIDAWGSCTISVSCSLDEAQTFKDELHVFVEEGSDFVIPMVSIGTGTAIRCTAVEDANDLASGTLSFGHQFTNQEFCRRIQLHNLGRKAQVITWENATLTETLNTKKKGDQAPVDRQSVPAGECVFHVFPSEVTLKPQEHQVFCIVGRSERVSSALEHILCRTHLTSNAKKSRIIFDFRAVADLQTPLLEFNASRLDFEYSFVHGVPARHIVQKLTVTNKSLLQLNFDLTLPQQTPFAVVPSSCVLDSGMITEVEVSFDPDWYKDSLSKTSNAALEVVIKNNPKRHRLEMQGTCHFPNLSFATDAIDFGSILVGTMSRKSFTVANRGSVDAVVEWSLLDERTVSDSTDLSNMVPLNQVFDILPLRGVIKAHSEELIELSFFAHKSITSRRATVICSVRGGPTYEIFVSAASCDIDYVIDKSIVDFGSVPFEKTLSGEVTIRNNGNVPFDVRVDMSLVEVPELFSVHPRDFHLTEHSVCKFALRMTAGVPDRVMNSILFHVSHYDPVRLDVYATGIYPCATLSLPVSDIHCGGDNWISPSSGAASRTLRSALQSRIKRLKSGKDLSSGLFSESELVGVYNSSVSKILTRNAMVNHSSEAIISKYECRFGHIVVGQSKRVKFTLNNIGSTPINLSSSNSMCKSYGISLNPDVVSSVEPRGSKSLEITWDSNAAEVLPGSAHVALPLFVGGSRVIVLDAFATFIVPDLACSSREMDFGVVYRGHRRALSLQIHNFKQVAADWMLKFKGKPGSSPEFSFFPKGGTLQPNETCTVQFVFSPEEERPYEYGLVLQTKSGNKHLEVSCVGVGRSLHASFNPPYFSAGAFLPGTPKTYTGKLQNDSDQPIEIYALNFDELFSEEQRLIEAAFARSGGEIVLDSPRRAGQPVPSSLFPLEVKSDEIASPVGSGRDRHFSPREQKVFILLEGPSDEALAKVAQCAGMHYGAIVVDIDSIIMHDLSRSIDSTNSLRNYLCSHFVHGDVTDVSRFLDARTSDLLADCIRRFMGQCVAGANGVIFRGILSIFFPPDVVFEAMTQFLGIDIAVVSAQAKPISPTLSFAPDDRHVGRFQVMSIDIAQPVVSENFSREYELHSNDRSKDVDYLSSAEGPAPPLDPKSKTAKGKDANISPGISLNGTPVKVDDYEVITKPFKDIVRDISNNGHTSSAVGSSIEVFGYNEDDGINEEFSFVLSMHKKVLQLWYASANLSIHNQPSLKQVMKGPIVRPSIHPPPFKISLKSGPIRDSSSAEAAGSEELSEGVHRWVIPARGFVPLEVSMLTDELGKFDFSLDFEIVGEERRINGECSATLRCLGECALPTIARRPDLVFSKRSKSRPAEHLIRKQYISSIGCFEFGPLLTGIKSPGDVKSPAGSTDHVTEIMLQNDGIFELQAAIRIGKDPKEKSPGGFGVFPSEVALGVGERAVVQLSAYPIDAGVHESIISVEIAGNPTPFAFPVKCLGEKIKVELSADVFEMGRVIVGQSSSASITLTNVCLLPVQWKLVAASGLSRDLIVSHSSGFLGPLETSSVGVIFSPSDVGSVKENLKFDIYHALSDDDDVAPAQTLSAIVAADGYNVSYDVTFPDDVLDSDGERLYGLVDFGTLLIGTVESKEIAISNTGKFPISYKFSPRTPLVRELITFSPDLQGTLEAGATERITLTIDNAGILEREVNLDGSANILLSITEPLTGQRQGESIKIEAKANIVFNKFSILPRSGLNFGAVRRGAPVEPRTIELKNEGSFPLTFQIFDLSNPPSEEEDVDAEPDKSAKVPKGKGKGKEKGGGPPSDLVIGSFTVSPAFGSLDCGESIVAQVSLNPLTSGDLGRCLGISISGRDPKDHPEGIPYELYCESCDPAIQTTDYMSIFEEHRIVNSSNDVGDSKKVFVRPSGVIPGIFLFGVQDISAEVPETASIKISNCRNIPCVVSLSLKDQDEIDGLAASKAGKGSKDIVPINPFTLDNSELHLEPFSSQYVSIAFRPPGLQTYTQRFSAMVVGEGEGGMDKLEFDVSGEGSLPHVVVSSSSAPNPIQDGISFPRLMLGQSCMHTIFVDNPGALAVSCDIHASNPGIFSLSGGEECLHILPRQRKTVELVYVGQVEGTHHGHVTFAVRGNAYEIHSVPVFGESFSCDIVMEGISRQSDAAADEIIVPDAIPGKESVLTFSIRNRSSQHKRFTWNFISAGVKDGKGAPVAKGAVSAAPEFKVVPMEGHLPAGTSTEISVFFFCTEEVKVDNQTLELVSSMIAYGESIVPRLWNSSMGEPEPSYILDDAEQGHVKDTYRVKALASFANFKCDVGPQSPCDFGNVMMLQEDYLAFTVENHSLRDLVYDWVMSEDSNLNRVDSKLRCPFSISPTTGTIVAGLKQKFHIKLRAEEVGDYAYVADARIANLGEDMTQLIIPICAKVSRPWIHIEQSQSDYISSGRRNSDLCGPNGVASEPLGPNTRVFEIQSRGLNVVNTIKVRVLNPTDSQQEFMWVKKGTLNDTTIRCKTPSGVLLAGNWFDMIFSYVPKLTNLCESFWELTLVDNGAKIPFLFVGSVREPGVLLSEFAKNFGRIQVGKSARYALKVTNADELPCEFKFESDAFEQVSILPKAGRIAGNSSETVTVVFNPNASTAFNFNIPFIVKNRSCPLYFNVKGTGFSVHERMEITQEDGSLVSLTPIGAYSSRNMLDFGHVYVKDKAKKLLTISNIGSSDLTYSLDMGPNRALMASPASGTLSAGEKEVLELVYEPTIVESLSRYPITCDIEGKRRYEFELNAISRRPKLNFNTYSVNFGPTFLFRQGSTARTFYLVVSNDDDVDISLDSLHESNNYFKVDFSSMLLGPGQRHKIPVSFFPREERLYSDSIVFEVNGLYTANVSVNGEGVPCKIELLDPSQADLDLGNVKVGDQSSRLVKLVNRSRISAHISLSPCYESLRASGVLVDAVNPDILLKSNESVSLNFNFVPLRRFAHFSTPVILRVEHNNERVLSVSGSALGAEVSISTDALYFEPVMRGCVVTKSLQLRNTGDIPSSYSWDVSALSEHFSLTPSRGFLPTGGDAIVEVSFHPKSEEGLFSIPRLSVSFSDGPALSLSLKGSYASDLEESEEIHFDTPVRSLSVKEVSISNSSAVPWELRPAFDNSLFSGPDSLVVPAGGQALYPVSYTPLIMSKDGQSDAGNLYFSIPERDGLLFRLTGIGGKPTCAQTIQIEAPAKKLVSHKIAVANWMGSAQRFSVLVEPLEGQFDPSVKVSAPSTIDIPASSSRDVRLSVYVYKEGTNTFTLRLLNSKSGEYVFYEVVVNSRETHSMGEIVMKCPARLSDVAFVHLENPLDVTVKFQQVSPASRIYLPSELIVPPRSSAELKITYRPLVVCESEDADLLVECEELGKFHYRIRLSCTTAALETGMKCSAPLGSSTSQVFYFRNYIASSTEYSCSLEGEGQGSFSISQNKFVAPPADDVALGSKCSVTVFYEPCVIGHDELATLVVSSPLGGEYRCPLEGCGENPKPQGPISFKGTVSIPFTNVFSTTVEYFAMFDNPSFTCSKKSEILTGKKQHAFAITYKPQANVPNQGKLTISAQPPGFSLPVFWTFYLSATT